MEQKVIVSVKGLQYDGNAEPTPIEVITTGDYYFKNNKHYVIYDEVLEGSTDVVKNTLKFSDEEVSVKKSGATTVHMLFNRDNKTSSSYRTPFGNLMIGIDTNAISCRETEEEINLGIDYALDINYEFLANCSLKVKVVPQSKGMPLV